MPYEAEISRANPTCFLFLIDQSGSMADSFGDAEDARSKAQALADDVNKLLQNLCIRCARAEGVRDYFNVGVIGFGGNGVGPVFGGVLAGRDLVPISEVANSPARIEERTKKSDDGAGGLVSQAVKFPIWFDPVAVNGTPMCQALAYATKVLRTFVSDHPACFPPVVMHLTDGEATDGDPTENMKEITSVASADGNVLLFNVHISSRKDKPIAFPEVLGQLSVDQYARLMFEAASELTPRMRDVAVEHGFQLGTGAKAYTFNADNVLVIQALDIGTRPSDLR